MFENTGNKEKENRKDELKETTQEKCFYKLLNTFQSFKLIFASDLNRLEVNFSNMKKKEKKKRGKEQYLCPIFFTEIEKSVMCYILVIV